jgi:hypothetical protein
MVSREQSLAGEFKAKRRAAGHSEAVAAYTCPGGYAVTSQSVQNLKAKAKITQTPRRKERGAAKLKEHRTPRASHESRLSPEAGARKRTRKTPTPSSR